MNPVTVIIKVIAVGMLLVALGNQPEGYYLLLVRCVVCAAAAMTASQAAECQKSALAWTFSVFALVFNPMLRGPFGPEVWRSVDVVAALLLVLSIVRIDRHTNSNKREPIQRDWIDQQKRLMAWTMVAAACLYLGGLFLWDGVTHVGPGMMRFSGGEDAQDSEESVPEAYYREDCYENGGASLLVAAGILWHVIRVWRKRKGCEESWKTMVLNPDYVERIRLCPNNYPEDLKQWIEQNHPSLFLPETMPSATISPAAKPS